MSDSNRERDTKAGIEVRQVIEEWAKATREDRKEDVLKNHSPDVLIYDVLPPLKYEGAEAYRRSWDEWQPDTQGEAQFDLEELAVTAGLEIAFAHCLIRCGGTLPDGTTFKDLVRATFCLKKQEDGWRIAHQHISQPLLEVDP